MSVGIDRYGTRNQVYGKLLWEVESVLWQADDPDNLGDSSKYNVSWGRASDVDTNHDLTI